MEDGIIVFGVASSDFCLSLGFYTFLLSLPHLFIFYFTTMMLHACIVPYHGSKN